MFEALGPGGVERLRRRVVEVLPGRELDVVLADRLGWLIAAEVLEEIHGADPTRLLE